MAWQSSSWSKACYSPDSIGNLRLCSRLVKVDTGLVALPETIKGLVDLEHLCLVNCRSLNLLSDDVRELKSLKLLDLSGTTIEELPPSLWNLEDLELRMNNSKMETLLWMYRILERDLEYRWELGELEPYGPFKFSVHIPGFPVELLIRESRTNVAPGFHEHHLSGRCPPKISVRVIFPHGESLPVDIAAEVPLWDARIMSLSQPTLYFKNLILMLGSWLERKCESEWTHDFQRKDGELLSLEFCDRCMYITSVIREFSPSPPCLKIDRFPQLSIAFSMTFYKHGNIYPFLFWVENVEILTKFSFPILRSTNLLLESRCSGKKLPDYIEVWNSWHEEATQVQRAVSRRSFKNCKSPLLRKTRGSILRAKRKRNLTWLCLHNYLDKHLLMNTVYVCAGCCVLSPFIKTKLDYCSHVLEEACPLLLDSALEVKQKIRLTRDFARVMRWLDGVINIEITPKNTLNSSKIYTFSCSIGIGAIGGEVIIIAKCSTYMFPTS
ncbi:hypothetical protein ACJRO7_006648 [Eucalyptus globulus]|uniref:Uncharacterized protein n=1 Tax=Eucalyptus globulus TaxID=34317 RepID=A0ABD3III9_EUCGL